MNTRRKLDELLKLTLAIERFGPVECHLTVEQLRELDDHRHRPAISCDKGRRGLASGDSLGVLSILNTPYATS